MSDIENTEVAETPEKTTSRVRVWVSSNPFFAALAIVAAVVVLFSTVGLIAAVGMTNTAEAGQAARSFAPGLTSESETVTLSAEESSATTQALPPELLSATARAADPSKPAPQTEMVAFYVNWGDEAYQSLDQHAAEIDVLIPMWYHLDSSGKLTVDDPVEQAQVLALVKRKNPGMKVMPLVNNYDKSSESWNAPQVSKLLKDPAKREQIAEHIVTTLDDAGFDGMNIDFESFTEADRGSLVAFMEELYPRAKKAGLVVSMDVIVGSKAYDHVALAKNVDYMVPMMYDEHWKTSPPGPISSQPWFEKTLKGFYEKVPPEKVVVGLGTYSYDYGASGKRAASLTWADAVALAKDKKATIELDPKQLNAHYTYKDGSTTHNVWMLDAVSGFNQIAAASETAPRGYAIWRLGAEDPALWNVLPNRDALDARIAASIGGPGRTVRYDEARGLIVEERFTP